MLVLGMFVLSACIKHPEELPLPKPFLIKRIVQVLETFRRTPKPGDTPTQLSKWIWELEYNNNCQLRLFRFYTSFIDTIKMRLSSTHIFLYDSQDRIKEIRTQYPESSRIGRQIFSYHGNEKLPFLEETVPAGDYIQGYAYRGDTVLSLFILPDLTDTLGYIYKNGNITSWYLRDPRGASIIYDKYDNNPPIQKFMNLSRGDIISFPDEARLPRLSRNNWTRYNTVYFHSDRHIRYNELSLPVFLYTLQRLPQQVNRFSTRFEY